MTLCLLFRPHRYGAIVTPVKGYSTTSDAQRYGASIADTRAGSASNSDGAAFGSSAGDS